MSEVVNEAPLELVLYTDGGCKPSRGIGGWGIHGYFFRQIPPKQGSGCKQATPTAKGYVPKHESDVDEETGLKVKTKPEDKAVPVTIDTYVDGLGSLIPESTNNIAELTGLIEGLKVAVTQPGLKTLHLKIDSEYTLEGFNKHIYHWPKSNWLTRAGQPVANQVQWNTIILMKQSLKDQGVKITTEHVFGHSGDLGNDLADSYASRAIIAGRKGLGISEITFTEPKGYWSTNNDLNRLIANSKWYFNTNAGKAPQGPDGRYTYYLGEHGTDDDFLGKRVSDSSMSVVRLREPEPVLEMVRAYQDSVEQDKLNSVIIGKLENILQAGIYKELNRRNGIFLQRLNQNLDLFTTEKVQLTRELRTPRLAFNAIQALTTMEQILDGFIAGPVSNHLTVTDLTDLLYEVSEVKGKTVCKLKPTFTSSTRTLPVEAAYNVTGADGVCALTLTVGIDTPDRNTFSALAALKPKVSLVTYKESDRAFRYSVVVEAGEDIGIWAGIYSNLHLLIK